MLFKIKVIKDFQIKLLSMISEKRFFNSALVGKTVLMKNKKKTVDGTLKKCTPLKKI